MRIAIADDHALFRQGLKSMLRLQPDVTVVAEVDRAEEILPALESAPCDVLLLDLQMDRSVFADIESFAEHAAVVVVTATERSEDALAALRAGARGLVFKRFALETLMAAIHAVLDGQVWMPPEVQTEITARLREPAEAPLTRREREIVRLIGDGLSNKEIASALHIELATVKNHVHNILEKLSVGNRTEAVHVARARGELQV